MQVSYAVPTMGPGKPRSPGNPRSPGGPSLPVGPAGPGSPCDHTEGVIELNVFIDMVKI